MNTPEKCKPVPVVVSGLLFDWAMSSPAHVDDIEQMKLLLATHAGAEPQHVITKFGQNKQNPEPVGSLVGCRLFEDDDDRSFYDNVNKDDDDRSFYDDVNDEDEDEIATVIMDSSDDDDDVSDTIHSLAYGANDVIIFPGCKLFEDDDVC